MGKNSFRIEIRGQRDPSLPVTIDRALPSPLAPFYTSNDWVAFCDKIDRTLEPLTALKKKIHRRNVFSIWWIVGTLLITAISAGISYLTGKIGEIYPLFIVLGLLMGLVPAAIQVYTDQMAVIEKVTIKEDLQRVIDEHEREEKRSDITFHLRDERYTTFEYIDGEYGRGYIPVNKSLHYILCVIDNVLPASTIPMGAEVEPVATPVVPSTFDTLALEGGTNTDNKQKSIHERLQELETVKGMLSEEEYNLKKSAILATA